MKRTAVRKSAIATMTAAVVIGSALLASIAGCTSTTAVQPKKSASQLNRSSEITLVGTFHNQQVETDGTIRVRESADGTATATLTGFATTAADNLQLRLNVGALSKNSSGAYVVGSGSDFVLGIVEANVPQQTFEIHEPNKVIPLIHSATILNYTTTQEYGSAQLLPTS